MDMVIVESKYELSLTNKGDVYNLSGCDPEYVGTVGKYGMSFEGIVNRYYMLDEYEYLRDYSFEGNDHRENMI